MLASAVGCAPTIWFAADSRCTSFSCRLEDKGCQYFYLAAVRCKPKFRALKTQHLWITSLRRWFNIPTIVQFIRRHACFKITRKNSDGDFGRVQRCAQLPAPSRSKFWTFPFPVHGPIVSIWSTTSSLLLAMYLIVNEKTIAQYHSVKIAKYIPTLGRWPPTNPRLKKQKEKNVHENINTRWTASRCHADTRSSTDKSQHTTQRVLDMIALSWHFSFRKCLFKRDPKGSYAE